MLNRCTKRKFYLLTFFNIFIIILYSYNTSSDSPKLIITGPEIMQIFYGGTNIPTKVPRGSFTSKCECKKKDLISIIENGAEYFVHVNQTKYQVYKISDTDVQTIMCDAYNVLRRGMNQKVIGLSLWGNEERYVALLKS